MNHYDRDALYIPELARVDPRGFGLVVIDAEGNVAAGGDSETPFSIQSISKVFTLTLALGNIGDRLWQRVGRDSALRRRLVLHSHVDETALRRRGTQRASRRYLYQLAAEDGGRR